MKNFVLCNVEPCVRISALCSAFFKTKTRGYAFGGESHAFWEAVFIIKGDAKVTAGDKIYSLAEGNMILHPPGEFHRIWNESDVPLQIAIVSFDTDRFPTESRLVGEFESPDNVISVIEDIRRVFKISRIFVTRINDGYTKSDAQRAVAALESLLLDILDSHSLHDHSLWDENFSKAVKLMQKDLSARLSSEQIAAACGTSVSTLQKTFSKYTGGGIMKHYERIRMQHAKALIEQGHSVKSAAISLGYSDPNYFSAAYKRYYGHSPSEDK